MFSQVLYCIDHAQIIKPRIFREYICWQRRQVVPVKISAHSYTCSHGYESLYLSKYAPFPMPTLSPCHCSASLCFILSHVVIGLQIFFHGFVTNRSLHPSCSLSYLNFPPKRAPPLPPSINNSTINCSEGIFKGDVYSLHSALQFLNWFIEKAHSRLFLNRMKISPCSHTTQIQSVFLHCSYTLSAASIDLAIFATCAYNLDRK